MRGYKVTEFDWETRNDTKWGPNVTHTVEIDTHATLCSHNYLHFYKHPWLAKIYYKRHTSFLKPVLWEAEVSGFIREEDSKCGCTKMTTLRRISMPIITKEQAILLIILTEKTGIKDKKWRSWAHNWVNWTDRTIETAKKINSGYQKSSYALETACSNLKTNDILYNLQCCVNAYNGDIVYLIEKVISGKY